MTRLMAGVLVVMAMGAGCMSLAEDVLEKNSMVATKDIPYVVPAPAKPKLTQLDVYQPAGGEKLPVMVFIHGGSWWAGDKRLDSHKPTFFTGRGYVFVSVNYRLSPKVQHPVHVEDVAKAIAWIHANIAEYGGDPNRIFLLGHSAGAHLAALVATDERYLKENGTDLSAVKGVIVLDGGGYDIPAIVNSGEPFAKSRFKRAFGDTVSVWKDASPLSHVAAGKGIPPFLLVHAGKRKVSREQAETFAKALHDAGVRAEVFHAADKNHLTVNRAIGDDEDETTQAIMTFLNSIVKATS